MALGNDEAMQIILTPSLFLLLVYIGLRRSPGKEAVTTINCAVNPALNLQQAVYYASNSRPQQACETSR